MTGPASYLAGSEDLEHERQPVCHQLLRVLVLLDAAELLQQTLDQRPAVLLETRAQRLQPSVQSPRDPWETGEAMTHTHTREDFQAAVTPGCSPRLRMSMVMSTCPCSELWYMASLRALSLAFPVRIRSTSERLLPSSSEPSASISSRDKTSPFPFSVCSSNLRKTFLNEKQTNDRK